MKYNVKIFSFYLIQVKLTFLTPKDKINNLSIIKKGE
jgi:hypothetical protein